MQNNLEEVENHDGLLIGIVFTFGSLLLTLTFFIPIISVFPGVILESIAKMLVDNNPYSNVGRTTMALAAIVFLAAFIVALLNIRRTILKDGRISRARIIMIMTLMYFIVHSLGFYIYWGLKLDYRSDGQLIFAAVDSFPKSSWAFIPIGLIIDGVKNFRATRIGSNRGQKD